MKPAVSVLADMPIVVNVSSDVFFEGGGNDLPFFDHAPAEGRLRRVKSLQVVIGEFEREP